MKRIPPIKSTEILCKGNIENHFEMMPLDLFNYLELGLISHADFTVYMKLTQFYNKDLGYAFPNIPQLMIYTNIKSKTTINNSLNNLIAAGLLQKGKGTKGNNIYRTFKPLDREELHKLVPKMVQALQERKIQLLQGNTSDKVRWEAFKQEKVNHQG